MRHPMLWQALAATLLAGGACDAVRAAAPPAAAAAAPAAVAARYTLDPAKSSLEFTFLQAGAKDTGRFPRFAVTLDCPGADPAGGRLEVTVEVAAVDTGDQDRDDVLRSDDLFAVAKFPRAHFLATRIVKTAAGYEADGALTIRGVTRDTKVPFTFREATEGGVAVGYLTGKTVVRRLDFGVGQGDWKATDQAGNEVTVSFALRLTRAAR
ncbi:MAG TPA: YceI family protein [Steroidobacteraceae bacterium]|nr:YceI family protein [Steroidobacteraceae bacterium]